MNHVARQEDADDERHDRRDIGNACSSDRAKVLNDEVVDDVSQSRPAQPQTKDQTCPSARIVGHGSNSIQTCRQEKEDLRPYCDRVVAFA